MRTKNPDMKEKVIKYVKEYCEANCVGPSVRETAKDLGISSSMAQRYLESLRDEGILSRGNKSSFETKSVGEMRDMKLIPRLGYVPCGPLTEIDEYIDGYMMVPNNFVGNGDFFVLRASGDSMIDASIDDEDLVIIKRQNHADIGQIVVALCENEVTLKRLIKDKNGIVCLHPENPGLEDIYADKIEIQGVAIKVIKNLK